MTPNVLERDPALETSRASNNHEDIARCASSRADGRARCRRRERAAKIHAPDPDKARMHGARRLKAVALT